MGGNAVVTASVVTGGGAVVGGGTGAEVVAVERCVVAPRDRVVEPVVAAVVAADVP